MSEQGTQSLTPTEQDATPEGTSPEAIATDAPSVNMDMILDIPVTLSVELGRTSMNIEELLRLDQGSIIELARRVEEPMDVLVNGTLVAHGEVVLVDDVLGIRLTDVVSPSERVKRVR